MSEADLFWLRKFHFLVDFCWNIEVYRPLLSLGHLYEIHPIDALISLVDCDELTAFFETFDRESRAEWFTDADSIENYFAEPENWARLLNQEFEKLNVKYSIVALRDDKAAFDQAIMTVLSTEAKIPPDILAETAKLAFALFPTLTSELSVQPITIAENLAELNSATADQFKLSDKRLEINLIEHDARVNLRSVIAASHGITLSRILNTSGMHIRDLRLPITFGLTVRTIAKQYRSPRKNTNKRWISTRNYPCSLN